MISNKENSLRLLKHGIKPSVQRLAILDYLNTHHTHPTVDTIYADLSSTIPTLSKTTIYNTLSMFVNSGIALSLNIDEKNIHYDGTTTPHAHFRCLKCNEIYDLPIPENCEAHFVDFDILETQIYYKGICKKCKNNLNKK